MSEHGEIVEGESSQPLQDEAAATDTNVSHSQPASYSGLQGLQDEESEEDLKAQLLDAVRPAHLRNEGQRLKGEGGPGTERGRGGETDGLGVSEKRCTDGRYGDQTTGAVIGPLKLSENQKYQLGWEPSTYNLASFQQLLRQAAEVGADDIKVRSQHPVSAKIMGRLHMLGSRKISLDALSQIVKEIHQVPTTASKVRAGEDADFSISVPLDNQQQLRFRANLTGVLGQYGNRDGLSLTLRTIPPNPPTLDEIGIPQAMRDFLFPTQGIVIVTGETGSGKTTTIGAIIRQIAEDPEGKVILTYESPIEFDFNALKVNHASIEQSEIGTHLPLYKDAVRNLLRRNADVVLFGEARDEETIIGATLASQTGNVVYTTVHTNNVPITIPRMVNDCDPAVHSKVASALCDSVRGIVNQRLLKKPDKRGRTLILSYLGIDAQMRSKLLQTHVKDLPIVMQGMVESYGMTIREDLENKYRQGLVLESDYRRTLAEL